MTTTTTPTTVAPAASPHAAGASVPSLFHLVLLVWGEQYTKLFTDIGLPALLAEGNIPALARSFPTVFKIYTRPVDVPSITASPAFQRVAPLVETRFLEFDPTVSDDKYAAMTACHRIALREAAESDAAVVFLAPDTIWADGSLATVARAALAGKRAVMQGGLRVMRESALPALSRFYANAADGVAAVPPRALVRVALDHMSADFAAWFWDSPDFSRNPANVYWRVGSEGVVARCFHLHPLMLFPERTVTDFVSTLDDDLPLLAIPRFESIHVVDDSDDAFHVDLFDGDARAGLHVLPQRPQPAYLAEWALHCANLHHRRFARRTLRWHAGPVTDEWEGVEAAADAVMADAMRRLRLRELAVRAGGATLGMRWPALLQGAGESRIGWNLLPRAPLWHRIVTDVLTTCGCQRAAGAMESWRRTLFGATAECLFGAGVAARALDGFVPTRTRRHRVRRAKEKQTQRRKKLSKEQALRRRVWLRKRIAHALERGAHVAPRHAARAARTLRGSVTRYVRLSRSRGAKYLKRNARRTRKLGHRAVTLTRRVMNRVRSVARPTVEP